jgi:hypothetical protein
MVVSIESGDADVLVRDTRSVDDVERWCKKKSESSISRVKSRKFEDKRVAFGLDNKELWEDAIKAVTHKRGSVSIDKTNTDLFITIRIPSVGKFFLEILPSERNEYNAEIRKSIGRRGTFGTSKRFNHKASYSHQLPDVAMDFVYDCLDIAEQEDPISESRISRRRGIRRVI